jgi:transposase
VLGFKAKTFKPHTKVSLEDLVPQDNFYRHVEANLDLSFVRDLVRDCYSPTMGRPSIDPVVFFKLQLIMFFEGIRSERQLMETVSLNLAHRWYIAYDLDEEVPDHSSLSKIRDRYGLETFLRFFEHIVELCIQTGLVWGDELYFDGTRVRANAALEGMVPRFYYEAKEHLRQLFEDCEVPPPAEGLVIGGEAALEAESTCSSRGFVDKYNGTRMTTRAKHWYERTTDYSVSLTDSDATPMKRFNGDRTVMGYHDHYVVDGGKARIILAALVTPASIMDTTPMLDLARWVRFRWRLKPKIAVGDTKYGTESNIVGLEQDGIRAYLPRPDNSQRTGRYPPERFHYNPKDDSYICPQGQVLSYWHSKYTEGNRVYRAEAEVCNACRAKAKCTTSLTGRHLRRSFFQEYLDQAAEYRETEAYKRALRKRKLWPEPLFGEAKQWHGLRQFRLRGLWKVNTEGLMVAAGQNLKRLLTYQGWGQRRGPAGWGAALALAPPFRPTELDHPPL